MAAPMGSSLKEVERQGQDLTSLGLDNLLQILRSKGRMDPSRMNRQLALAGRAGDAGAASANQMGVRRGFGNSGIVAALGQAAHSGAADRQAGIRANEASMSEQRFRDDLQLLRSLVIGPNTDYTAIKSGQYENEKNRNTATQNAWIGALGSLGGSLLGGGIFGGGG